MKKNYLAIRLDDADLASLEAEARKRNISKSEVLRSFMYECISGYDHKHEELIRRVNALDSKVSHVLELAAVGAAMLSALDVERKSDDRAKEMTDHLKQGFDISQAVMVGQQRGLFKKERN